MPIRHSTGVVRLSFRVDGILLGSARSTPRKTAPWPNWRSSPTLTTGNCSPPRRGALSRCALTSICFTLQRNSRMIGGRSRVAADLQDYLDKRVRRKGKKTVPLSPVTLRKELASFRACFNWAVQTGLLTGSFPNHGLRFPKGEDKIGRA